MLGQVRKGIQRRVVRGLVSSVRTVANCRRSNREFRAMGVLCLILPGNEQLLTPAIGEEGGEGEARDWGCRYLGYHTYFSTNQACLRNGTSTSLGTVGTSDFRHGSRGFHP